MKFLLDETFPFALSRRLRGAGKEMEHFIALGQRGTGDDILRKRLATEPLVFLTQDQEFADIPADFRSQVVISDLPQWVPVRERVEIWFTALEKIAEHRLPERLFEILPSGELVAWEILELGRSLRAPL